MKTLIISLILVYIYALILIIRGIRKIKSYKENIIKNNYAQAEAVIIDVEFEKEICMEEENFIKETYIPIIEYVVNDEKIRVRLDEKYDTKHGTRIGEKRIIMYEINDPSKYHYPSNDAAIGVFLIIISLGIIFTSTFFVFFAYSLIKL